MRLDVAPITDPSSLAHVSPRQLVLLLMRRAPRLAARARLPARPTLDELGETIRSVRPEDEADDFLADLHLIARVCKHDGAEDLLLDKGVSLTNTSLGDALARAAIDDRDAFEAVGDHATVVAASEGSTFTLFTPRLPRTDLEITSAHVGAIRANGAAFFGELGQGSHCEVRLYSEHDETGFLVDHTGVRRTERLADEREKPEVRQYRRFRQDVVLLQRKTGTLRIRARSEKERIFYANLIGELLVGDRNYYVPDEAYVLDAIADAGYPTVLASLVDADIERIALRELTMVGEDDFSTRHVVASNDVLGSLRAFGSTLDSYILQQATFTILPRVRKGRRCFRLTVRKGNQFKCNAPWT
jgi:hypothetical protein